MIPPFFTSFSSSGCTSTRSPRGLMFTMAIGLWVVSLCWLVFNVNPGLRMAAQGRLLKGYGQFFFLSSSTISTAFVESAINQVLSKRFVKKQQMHWTDPRRSPFTASTDPRFERGLALHAVALVPRNGRNMRCEGGVAPGFSWSPTSPSRRWCQKMLGVQRWQDVRIWGDAVPLWFPAYRARQPTVSHHAVDLFCAFLLCFVTHVLV